MFILMTDEIFDFHMIYKVVAIGWAYMLMGDDNLRQLIGMCENRISQQFFAIRCRPFVFYKLFVLIFLF